MANERKRGNREVKKPKQVKAAPAPDTLFEKGLKIGAPLQKKKKV
jgi:hypothetical protein